MVGEISGTSAGHKRNGSRVTIVRETRRGREILRGRAKEVECFRPMFEHNTSDTTVSSTCMSIRKRSMECIDFVGLRLALAYGSNGDARESVRATGRLNRQIAMRLRKRMALTHH